MLEDSRCTFQLLQSQRRQPAEPPTLDERGTSRASIFSRITRARRTRFSAVIDKKYTVLLRWLGARPAPISSRHHAQPGGRTGQIDFTVQMVPISLSPRKRSEEWHWPTTVSDGGLCGFHHLLPSATFDPIASSVSDRIPVLDCYPEWRCP